TAAVASLLKHPGQRVVRRGIGMKCDGAAQFGSRTLPVMARREHRAERRMRLGVARLRPDGRLQLSRRTIEVSLMPIDHSEHVVRLRARISGERSLQLL